MKLFSAISVFSVLAYGAFAYEPKTQGETDPVMLDLDPYMIKAMGGVWISSTTLDSSSCRFGPEGGMADLLKEPAFQGLIQKHDLKLFNGPMIGVLTPNSAKFWIRSAGPASFQVVVGDVKSDVVKTSAESDFTGIATIEGLKPFTDYSYSILLDGKEIKKDYFRFKTAPEKGQKVSFSVTFGSGACYNPPNEGIWRVMASKRPLAYLALGDNVYIDATDRRDTQRMNYYRRMLRQEYREAIACVGTYAVWDDHDMGINDSFGGPGLEAPWKLTNLKVFKQNWNNPFYGEEPKSPATYHNFTLGDVEVFMTDGRFYRTGKEKPGTMLGLEQKKWLLAALKKSTAKFKILASGTMWNEKADKGGRDSWGGGKFRAERDEIFDLIDTEKISGVVLIAGDRHRTDIWKTDRPKGYTLWEFVSAKMTNGHTHQTRKEAVWSYNEGNFWGQLDFDLAIQDPTVTFKAIDASGKVIKSFPLKLSELSGK
jgi:alkaline phosphatase D